MLLPEVPPPRASWANLDTWILFESGLDAPDPFARLLAAVRGTAPPQGHSQDLADDPAPYRGLAPFEVDDAVFFTGRSVELDQMLERLLHCPFLAVLGASGSGKTSLIQAGLLAPLPDPVRNLSPHSETGREPALTGPRCGMSLYDLRRP